MPGDEWKSVRHVTPWCEELTDWQYPLTVSALQACSFLSFPYGERAWT